MRWFILRKEKSFEDFLLHRYDELLNVYSKKPEENKKYIFQSQLISKLLKMDKSADQNLQDMVSLMESFGRGVDTGKLRDLNQMLNEVNEDMVKFMFLKNSVFKKIMMEYKSTDETEGGN